MTKQEWLDAVAARPEILAVSSATEIQEPGSVLPDTKWYYVVVMEVSGDNAYRRKIKFYVYREGEVDEAAYNFQTEDSAKLAVTDTVLDALKTYMDGEPSVVRYNIQEYNSYQKDSKWGIVRAFVDQGSATCDEEYWLVYKDGTNPVSHTKITNYKGL